MPPSPWTGSIEMPAVSVRDGGAQLVHVAEGDLVEAVRTRAEALDVSSLAGRGDAP